MVEAPYETIQRAVTSLRAGSRRHRPDGQEEQFLLAVARWLATWQHSPLTESSAYPEDWKHALAVSRAWLGESGGTDG
jgi:hypothetical protein